MRDDVFYIDTITIVKSSRMTIEGYVTRPRAVQVRSGKHRVNFNDTGNQHAHTLVTKEQITVAVLTASLPISAGDDVAFYDQSGRRLRVSLRRFSRTGDIYGSFRVEDEIIIRRLHDVLHVARHTKNRALFYEFMFILRLIVDLKVVKAGRTFRFEKRSYVRRAVKSCGIVVESLSTMPLAVALRIMVKLSRRRDRVPIWIVSDRGMAAGDNGEALFRYIRRQASCPADVYFAISKRSPDYERVKSLGKILDYGSFRYKLKFLQSSKIISSHADVEVTNPFLRQVDRFADLFQFDFVFLQHGIIRHDLSGWLNRYEQNIKLFITSADKEYDSILTYPYYYQKENILLSGMPRYDLLENNPQKKIIFTPTYRANLLKGRTDRYGKRPYDTSFKESDYVKFYNSLMNDEKMIAAMRDNGYVGEFYVHPNFAAQIGDFRGNDVIKIMSYPYDYRRAISEGALLVSDYSSVVLDFAYLKKPVVYAQFDSETFYQGHTYHESEFFSDADDGFGDIYTDHAALVAGITELIRGGCRMNQKYQERVDRFFHFVDRQNSQRVYDAIMKRGN